MNGATRLESDGASEEQVSLFMFLWESAQTRVPVTSWDAVAHYWRGRMAPEACRHQASVKSLYDPHLTLFRETIDDESAGPKTMLEGHVIVFPARFMDGLGTGSGVVAIAHELAHVTYYAEAEPNHWTETTNPAGYNRSEQLVDARLLDWGFTQAELDRVDTFLASLGNPRFLPKE
jgi:hypothetical protein